MALAVSAGRFLHIKNVMNQMSDFVPNNRNLREVLIFFFHSEKAAAEAH